MANSSASTPSPDTKRSDSAATSSPASRPPPLERRSAKARWFFIFLIVAAAGYIGFRIYQNHQPVTPPAKGGPGMGMPVPVIAGTVEKKDAPIYLNGIGTVQAFNTVTVNPRVDGEVKQVAFAEGQDVKAGD